MTGAQIAIVPKIVRLIPLLSSDQPGEILATVDAVARTLRAAGCDFHSLAAAVERGWTVPAPEPSPKQQLPWWQRIARSCLLAGCNTLRPAEIDFLRSMFSWPSEPTEKQTRWLTAIAEALGIRCAT